MQRLDLDILIWKCFIKDRCCHGEKTLYIDYILVIDLNLSLIHVLLKNYTLHIGLNIMIEVFNHLFFQNENQMTISSFFGVCTLCNWLRHIFPLKLCM